MFQAVGYYQAGHGQASHNLKTQIPAIAAGGFPEICNFYPATINVQFQPKIIAAGYTHRTAPIRWAADQVQGEVFDLLRVRLLFSDLDTQVQALMYVAHWTVFRSIPHMHEFMAERFVDGLKIDAPVVMECDRDAVVLPYTYCVDRDGKWWLAQTIVIL